MKWLESNHTFISIDVSDYKAIKLFGLFLSITLSKEPFLIFDLNLIDYNEFGVDIRKSNDAKCITKRVQCINVWRQAHVQTCTFLTNKIYQDKL